MAEIAHIISKRPQLIEDASETVALTDQFLEVVFGADFVFEVELLAGEFILERLDLAKHQSVFDGNRDLIGDLAKQFHLILGDVSLTKRGDPEGADLAAAHLLAVRS